MGYTAIVSKTEWVFWKWHAGGNKNSNNTDHGLYLDSETEYLAVSEKRKGLEESMLGNQIAVEEMMDQSLKGIEKNATKSCKCGEPAL